MCFRIPEGFKSIAVGERLRRPRRIRRKRFPTLKGQTEPENLPPSGSVIFVSPIRGRRATLAHGY